MAHVTLTSNFETPLEAEPLPRRRHDELDVGNDGGQQSQNIPLRAGEADVAIIPGSSLIRFTLQSAHKSLPAFSPYISAGLLPYLAFALLTGTFTLAFYVSTYVLVCSFLASHFSNAVHRLPKNTSITREIGIASTASCLAGFGVVALFCSVGVLRLGRLED